MTVKLLTAHNLEFLSLKGGCTGSSESIHVKMPHCWKSHVAAQISITKMKMNDPFTFCFCSPSFNTENLSMHVSILLYI